jgi:hypothetical protein
VSLPEQSGKAVSDHGRGAEDGSDALSSLMPATNLQLATRALFLAFAFFLPVLLSGLALLSSWFRDKVWYGLLVRSIAMSGAAFIKVSTRVLLLYAHTWFAAGMLMPHALHAASMHIIKIVIL